MNAALRRHCGLFGCAPCIQMQFIVKFRGGINVYKVKWKCRSTLGREDTCAHAGNVSASAENVLLSQVACTSAALTYRDSSDN